MRCRVCDGSTSRALGTTSVYESTRFCVPCLEASSQSLALPSSSRRESSLQEKVLEHHMVQGEAPSLIHSPASLLGTTRCRVPRSMCRSHVQESSAAVLAR